METANQKRRRLRGAPQEALKAAGPTSTSYENFITDCPLCGQECIFNRASDLKSFEPVSGLDIRCLHCNGWFRILGDVISPAYSSLIFDCYPLKERKAFMACVLNLAQAHELFFNAYLRAQLLFKPYFKDGGSDTRALSSAAKLLSARVERATFWEMRELFLYQVTKDEVPRGLAAATLMIEGLPKKPKSISQQAIDAISNAQLASLLRKVKETKIAKLRNSVVHKEGYRPTSAEVEAALKETRATLFPLGRILRVDDRLYRYQT